MLWSMRPANLVARQSSFNLKTALIDIKIELRLKYANDNCWVTVEQTTYGQDALKKYLNKEVLNKNKSSKTKK